MVRDSLIAPTARLCEDDAGESISRIKDNSWKPAQIKNMKSSHQYSGFHLTVMFSYWETIDCLDISMFLNDHTLTGTKRSGIIRPRTIPMQDAEMAVQDHSGKISAFTASRSFKITLNLTRAFFPVRSVSSGMDC